MGRKQNRGAERLWRSRLARYRKSGLTVAEFCRSEGVSNPSFYQWRKRLDEDSQSKRARQSKASSKSHRSRPFVPVRVSSTAWVEVEFPNGVRIRVPAENAEALRLALLAGSDICQEVESC
jgi:transposase-like protein